MGYTKAILSGDILEFYEYEKFPTNSKRKKKQFSSFNSGTNLALFGKDSGQSPQYKTARSKESIRRAKMGFRRLVRANFGQLFTPILITLTYAEGNSSLKLARTHFSTFARNIQTTFGKQIRYIAVAELQKRGAVHFHALVWELPTWVAERERDTRLVASMWGHGFVDIIQTDGSPKLIGYLSKYFIKQFSDPMFYGMKTYIASRNVFRPEEDKMVSPLVYKDLSTLRPLNRVEYMTPYLGKGRYTLYKVVNKSIYESGSDESQHLQS